jgi:hypothetical protein
MAKASGGTRAVSQSTVSVRESNASNADRLNRSLASGGVRGASVTMTRSTTIVNARSKSQAERAAAYLRRAGWTNVRVREVQRFSRAGRDDIYGTYTNGWVASGFNPGV